MATVVSTSPGLEKCGCDLLCFPSPTVNECSLYHTLIMRQTLSGSARLPVYEGCICRLFFQWHSIHREEVCVDCAVLPSLMKQRVIFAFLEGPYEVIKLFTELKMYVMFSVSVQFFGKYRPLWARQSCASLFGQQGHMGVQLNPQ